MPVWLDPQLAVIVFVPEAGDVLWKPCMEREPPVTPVSPVAFVKEVGAVVAFALRTAPIKMPRALVVFTAVVVAVPDWLSLLFQCDGAPVLAIS